MITKKYFLLCCFSLLFVLASAQKITLSDSVIYINEKAIALYYKQIDNKLGTAGIEVKNFNFEILIKAEVIKFDSPVDELPPFYYQEISFTPYNDTVAVYVQDEAFTIVLAKIINTYELIKDNKLDKKGVAKLQQNYPGINALTAKIKEIEDYLQETRQYHFQEQRDRTAPIKLINDKIIMQDGVRIGTIFQTEVSGKVYNPLKRGFDNDIVQYRGGVQNNIVNRELQVITASGWTVNLDRYANKFFEPIRKNDKGFTLYEASRKKISQGSYSDHILSRVCFLVEEYLL